MNEQTGRSSYEPQEHTVDAGALLIHGAARMFEWQASAARTFIEAQGRTASMLGAPDWSPLLTRNSELTHLFTELFAATAQHTLTLARQTNQTFSQVQEQIARLMQAQTTQLTYQMRSSMEELLRQSMETAREPRQRTRRSSGGRRSLAHERLGATSPAFVSGRLEGTNTGSEQEQARAGAKG